MTLNFDKKSTFDEIKLISLPSIKDPRGNLSFIEEKKHIPFKIERVYWIYDVPGGQSHGGKAFYEQQELIVALSGSFDIILDNGLDRKKYSLNRSYYGLYIPPGIWRQFENFSTNSLAMIISSTSKDEVLSISDYEKFLKLKRP